jgi:hypothetical protein
MEMHACRASFSDCRRNLLWHAEAGSCFLDGPDSPRTTLSLENPHCGAALGTKEHAAIRSFGSRHVVDAAAGMAAM